MRTFILIALAVIVLRVRKRVRDAISQRKVNKIVVTPQPENPFSEWDL
jgi:cell division septation protein DedD